MIKTALIGFGVAGKFFHAPLINHCEKLELSVVLSSRHEEIISLYPNTKVVNNIEDIFKSDCDLIVIASPNEFHFPIAKKCLEHGKNVVIDKPFTVELWEAQELCELAQKMNVFLTVFHNRRLDGDFKTLKKLVETNKLGQIASLESNFNRYRPAVNQAKWRETTDKAGGLLYDLGAHLIDQAVVLFGKPKRVLNDMAMIREGAVNDDYFHLIFDYGNFKVHLNATVLAAHKRERFVLQCLDGAYSIEGLDSQESQLRSGMTPKDSGFGKNDSGKIYIRSKDSSDEIDIQSLDTLDGSYIDFYNNVSGVINENEAPLINKAEALFVMELIEIAKRSHFEGKWIEL